LKKIEIARFGDAQEMKYIDAEIPSSTASQVLVKVAAAGVNFIDIYQRQGLPGYNLNPPYTPGLEGSGVIEEIGKDITEFKKGQKVAWVPQLGSYSQYHVVEESKLIAVPDAIELDIAAAVMLQGITAHYLSHSTFPIKPGDTALIHAAAGGTGRLLAQLVLHRGGQVIATTSTDEKSQLIKEIGVENVIRYDKEDFADEVLKLTDGKGVDVVYDGVGNKTFDKSLDCVKQRGMMVLYGAASGAVPPFELQRLNARGSLFITRPTIAHHVSIKAEYQERCATLFSLIAENKLAVRIGKKYSLSDAADSHDDLFGGGTTGKLLLIP
jgi:NADPH2:quinone reductase